MFSKSLFKQSCKANGAMWAIITFATCFMLACVMLIAGGGNLSGTKTVIMDSIIEGELTASTQNRSIHYYLLSDAALAHFDGAFKEEAAAAAPKEEEIASYIAAYTKAKTEGKTDEEAIAVADAAVGKPSAKAYALAKIAGKTDEEAASAAAQSASAQAYAAAAADLQVYAAKVASDKGYAADSAEALEIKGLIFYVLNPMTAEGGYEFDSFYAEAGETPPRYDLASLMTASEAERSEYRDEYAARNSLIFLAGNMIREENIQSALDALQAYGVTKEQYTAFGFADYSKVKEIAVSSLVEFRAKYEYRLANIKEGETPASIAEELTKDISQGFLASLPSEVSDALEEIGASDMYGVLVGSIFFKMAGLLLPIIYLIMTSNSLIAGQVDSGSMAYVLSSSVKRKTVTFTQAIFLIGSLFLMFCCTSITSIVCFALVDVTTDLTYAKLLLINLGAFLVLFAMSGICFLASCWFNRSKNSMALGGGLTMFFLVATMLGLFGSPVLPSIVRMKALNNFNYVSIISLFDVVSILEGTTAFLWKLGILAAVGIVCYIVGSRKFARKDLPL